MTAPLGKYEMTVEEVCASLQVQPFAKVRIEQKSDGVIRSTRIDTDEYGKSFMVMSDVTQPA